MNELKIDLGFEFSSSPGEVDIYIDETRMAVTRPELNRVDICYFKDGSESNIMCLQEENDDAVEYLATYVVAEAFKLILERNRAFQRDRMLDLYGFFTTDKCRALEEAVLSLGIDKQ